MKGLVAVAAIAFAACTESASPGASSPTPSAPASAVQSSPVAVVVDMTSSTTHTVYLIGIDGRPVASVEAANAIPITSWPAASPIANLWASYATTSNDRAYYLDAGNSVRYLAPDGTTGFVARIDGNSSSRSFFAVSPDDRWIAVSTLDYSSPPTVHMRFYVQDLTGGPQQSIHVASNVFFWPIGWHGGSVVVQVGQPIPQTMYGAYPDARECRRAGRPAHPPDHVRRLPGRGSRFDAHRSGQ
jgi:hypothetical protein